MPCGPHVSESAARFLTRAGGLPRVRDLDIPDFGVGPACVAVEYLDRQAQDALVATLSGGFPALLLGDSMAGKTRMAAEMLRRHYPDWHVWLPRVPAGPVAFFADPGARLRRTVVVLDELERFLAAGQRFEVWNGWIG